jgi:hypothetical protein
VSDLPGGLSLFSTDKNEYIIFFITILFFFVTFPASMGAAAKAVVDIQNNGFTSILMCLKAGFSQSSAYLVLMPIAFLFVTIISILSGTLVATFSFIILSPVVVIIIVTVISSLIISFYILTVPVIVLEQKSTLQGLKRSSELTSGKILQITLFLILFFATTSLALFVVFNQPSNFREFEMAADTSTAMFRLKFNSVYMISATILFVACGVFYKTCYMLAESKKVEDLANIF